MFSMVPEVSLVLCTIGQTPHLDRMLASLARQGERAFELVVVDQSRDDRVKRALVVLPAWLTVRYETATPGLSRARNRGLASCQGGIVGFPDDDAWYADDMIGRVIRLFEEYDGYDVVTGVTRDAQGALSNGRFLAHRADISRANVWKCGNSNALFLRKDAALAVKGFDETLGAGSGTAFGSGEETDLVLRMLRDGRRGIFLPDLAAFHDQVDVVADAAAIRRARLYAAGYGRVLRNNGYPAWHAVYRSGRSGVAAAMAVARGNFAEGRRRFEWTMGIMSGYGF